MSFRGLEGGWSVAEVTLVREVAAERSEGIAQPHPLIPKATARRGTKRMAPEVRAVVGPTLTRARAAELMAAGKLDPGRCSVVWNLRGRPVSHPITQVQIPSLDSLLPVRRIGTHKRAESRIAMFPVLRGGGVTMLELESQLELHHAIELSLDPRVETLVAQPFLMVWRHEEGAMVHVPDLAARIGGQFTVFAVKPDDRLEGERTRRLFDFVAETLRCGRIDFRVLGSMSPQRKVNLVRIARYRWLDGRLQRLLEAIAPHAPRTVGGLSRLVNAHLGLGAGCADAPGPHEMVGVDVALYAIAHGRVRVDLDAPLQMATSLTWSPRALP